MALELLALLESRVANGLRFHEWSQGALHGRAASAVPARGPEALGAYLLLRAPGVPELWRGLVESLRARKPLVILPPASLHEERVLLRQLPAAPPPEAVVALFTSGSTGEPKAVFHAEGSLLASARQLALALPGHEPTACLLAPWAMAGLCFHTLLPAVRGNDLLFSREPFLNWAAEAGPLFAELGVAFATLNPFLLEMFLRGGAHPAWKGKVVSLTAPLKKSLRAAYALAAGQRPLEIYGMTEAAGPVLLEGRSLGAQLRISADHLLELRGPQLFLGYSCDGEFTPAPPWFNSGDIFTTEDGLYVHQARERELIDVGGRKLAPRVIEEAFEEMREIAECVAFPVQVQGVERAGLIYVRARDCALAEAALAAAVEERARTTLSVDVRPHWWREVESLPRLAGGKVDRKRVRSEWSSRGFSSRAGSTSPF